MKRFILILIVVFTTITVKAQVNLDYYLPGDISYNPSIKTPKQVIGHELGEWHLTHDKLLYYMIELAKVSDRAIWEEYGKSHENRPLGQLIISSPENIKNIEELRQQHVQLCDPTKSDGSVGILFEQAGLNMRVKLLESQRAFYKDALSNADGHPVKAYIFTEPTDNGRVNAFVKNLLQHHIRIYKLASDVSKNGVEYKAVNSYIVPLKQNEYRFIKSLFEPIKEFTDSAFYDVSTWVLPLSFNISYAGINEIKELKVLTGNEISQAPATKGKLLASKDSYAYLFEWNEYLSPKALYQLQNAGITTRVSTNKFVCADVNANREFP